MAIGCQPGVAVITDNRPLDSILLSEMEILGITPWLMNSTPEKMKLVVPMHDFHLLEPTVTGKIEFKTAIISIIGKAKITIDHEVLSTNQYGTRIIIDTDEIHETIRELYHSLFSRQDCK